MTIKRNLLLRSGAAMAIALSATGLAADELRFWTTEEQPERLARQEAMAADFAAASVADQPTGLMRPCCIGIAWP